MEITVDRNHTQDGNLVFTITVTPDEENLLKIEDIEILKKINMFQNQIAEAHEGALNTDVSELLHDFKTEVYFKVSGLIRNKVAVKLQQMFNPICQETYSWLIDKQKEELRTWMLEFNPGRTKYYFSNDEAVSNCHMLQESEHEGED